MIKILYMEIYYKNINTRDEFHVYESMTALGSVQS